MKRYFTSLLVAVFVALAVVTPVLAVDPVEQICNEAAGSPLCEAQETGTNNILGKKGLLAKIVQMFIYLAGIISVIGLVVAGFQYVLSNGDPGAIQTAKNAALYSVGGLLVAIFSQAIVVFVLNRL